MLNRWNFLKTGFYEGIKKFALFPDPGPLPTLPHPRPGEVIEITGDGYPPKKDLSFSIRNVRHGKYQAFLDLRRKAIEAMDGRAWYDGPVDLAFTLYGPSFTPYYEVIRYAGGVMDTLDGSHGPTFTYLPVVYQDDCQVVSASGRYVESSETRYKIKITFLHKGAVFD